MHGDLDPALFPIAALLDLLNCAASIIHRSGTLAHVNPRLLAMTGWKREHLVGRSVLDLYSDPADREYLQDVLDHFDEPRESEFFLPRAGAAKLPVATASRTMTGPPPLSDYRIVTMFDISPAKELERQSKESYDFIVQMSNTVLEQALDLKNYSKTLEDKVAQRTAELNEANLDAIYMLAEACEARDHDTGQHVRRIESLSRSIAAKLGLPDREAHVIGYSSILHDVGKLHIPDRILEKPGPLSDDERKEMEQHTLVGENILSPRPFFQTSRIIARSHHENWDGSGYPDRLEKDTIPLAARIVHVADVFDALTASRVYKPAWDKARALEAIKVGAGTMFDPEIVRVFETISVLEPRATQTMKQLFHEIRHNPLLWLLVFVPVVLVAQKLKPEAHTLLFALSVLAIVPLAALLSHATESVAAKTGDAVGGLLNATLGNLTELVIALAALHAGQYMLVKASIAGAIVTNSLFMFGASFLIGGLKYHQQEYNRVSARLQAGLLFLATIGLLVPSVVSQADSAVGAAFTQKLSLGLAILLIVAYGLGMLFSLKTHRELFASVEHGEAGEAPWPLGLALATLAGVTVLVALVSEVFVESVQKAAETFGMTPAFVGFIVVALVGAAAEMASAFSGARKNRLDLSVGIALGSASQIALFVAPVLLLVSYFVGPTPMDLRFWPGAVAMIFIATLTACLVTNSGRSAWFIGVLVLMVYLIFAMTLYLLPPQTP